MGFQIGLQPGLQPITDLEHEVAAANYPEIRQFHVPQTKSFTPQAKPSALRSQDRKCSTTVTLASSSVTSSKCGKIDMLSCRN